MLARIRQTLTRIVAPPLRDCQSARRELNRLANRLDSIVERINTYKSNGINEIVPFLQAVADVQDGFWIHTAIDELTERGKLPEVVQALSEINDHLVKAGRNELGLNRTRIGQPVTDEDVYLSNVAGDQMLSVAFIKAQLDDRELYTTANKQATKFMELHLGPLLRLIHKVDRALPSKPA